MKQRDSQILLISGKNWAGGGQSEGVSSDNFADVEDAVHPRLEFSPVEFGDEGLYRCVVFSPAGNDTSEAVAITSKIILVRLLACLL